MGWDFEVRPFRVRVWVSCPGGSGSIWFHLSRILGIHWGAGCHRMLGRVYRMLFEWSSLLYSFPFVADELIFEFLGRADLWCTHTGLFAGFSPFSEIVTLRSRI